MPGALRPGGRFRTAAPGAWLAVRSVYPDHRL